MTAERDRWIRLFNRLDAAVTHHKRDTAGFTSSADDALYAARDRVLRDAASPEPTPADLLLIDRAVEAFHDEVARHVVARDEYGEALRCGIEAVLTIAETHVAADEDTPPRGGGECEGQVPTGVQR